VWPQPPLTTPRPRDATQLDLDRDILVCVRVGSMQSSATHRIAAAMRSPPAFRALSSSGAGGQQPRANVPLGVPKQPRGGFLGWVEQRRHSIIHVCFSGITVMLSLQLVNSAHKAEDTEAELRALLKEEARVRKALLRRTPALACDNGLPASKQAAFEKSLFALEAEIIEEDPASVNAAAVLSDPASTGAPPAASRKVAVW